MTVVVTGLWGGHVERFADQFTRTLALHAPWLPVMVFADYWPKKTSTNEAHVEPMQRCRGWQEFLDRHRDSRRATGREVLANWKPAARQEGYNFRFDAVKFAGQGFVPEAAAELLPDGELLVWLDADVVAFRDVPRDFFDKLVGDLGGAFLGRGSKHSEIGFWAVRLSPASRAFLTAFADMYRSDEVFRLGEWHSAYVWDATRRAFPDLCFRDLTPGGAGHVWFQSPLGDCLDHLKGKRKDRGQSMERRA